MLISGTLETHHRSTPQQGEVRPKTRCWYPQVKNILAGPGRAREQHQGIKKRAELWPLRRCRFGTTPMTLGGLQQNGQMAEPRTSRVFHLRPMPTNGLSTSWKTGSSTGSNPM